MDNRPGTLAEDFAAQRRFVQTRVPVYARLLEVLEEELPVGLATRLEESWRGRSFGAFYERPLLLLAALRDDALRQGEAHPLWAAIAGPSPGPDAIDRAAVAAALAPERGHMWLALAGRHLQTNEPTRAVVWLWPACLVSGVSGGRRLALFDVGASAGLNLVADQFPGTWERWDGRPLEVARTPPIASRTGYDLRPLDALDAEDARWLRACVWPGQGDREARLERAIDVYRRLQSGPDAPVVHSARAGDVPALLPQGEDGNLALVYQSVMRDYLPPEEWEAYRSGLHSWLLSRPRGSALWVELEVTGEAKHGGPPAAIIAHARGARGVETFVLAYCEPHPHRLQVQAGAEHALTSTMDG